MVNIRKAADTDIDGIRDLFVSVYGKNYPFTGFYDTAWLKKLVYDDGTLFFVSEVEGKVALTCSVNLSVGGMEDMVGEIGRLVASTDPAVRGQGYALDLVKDLEKQAAERVQFLFGEARTPHRGSQRILEELGWAAVGFEPMKYHVGDVRESMILYIKLCGMARDLRCNNPRVIPEAAPLAQASLAALDIQPDVIVVDEDSGYPTEQAFELERLSTKGFSSLLRIERGRRTNREVFGGKISLSHGFFQISNSSTQYLVARKGEAILGAAGFIHDPIDLKVKIFELIEFDEAVKGYLLASVDKIARDEYKCAYIEADVSAYSPKIQRTLERLGFIPVAYCPSMVFDNVERIDILRMAKVNCPYDAGEMRLLDACRAMKEIVERSMHDKMLGIEITRGTRENELFRTLPDGDLHHLAKICRVREYPAGTHLVKQGSEAEHLYILASGAAEVVVDGAVVGALGDGDVFGEMGLVDRGRRNADVILRDSCRVIEMDISSLERLMDARPRLGYSVMRQLAGGLSSKLKSTTSLLRI